jgi:hypothetical protein
VEIPQTNGHTGFQRWVRLFIEVRKRQVGNLRFLEMKLHYRGFFGAANSASSTALIKAQQRVKLTHAPRGSWVAAGRSHSVFSILTSLGLPHILGLSGGKDSTALAVFMHQKYPELEIEYFFCDTHKELPETEEYLDRVACWSCSNARMQSLQSMNG